MTSRRRVLAAAGIAVGLAGCADAGESGDDAADADAEPTPDGTQLGAILLQGTDGEETHDVQVAVEGDAGVVHLDTYAVEPGAPAVAVHREWDDSLADYVINVRVDGQRRRRIDVLDRTERPGGCADVLILLDADGDVTVWDRSCVDHGTDDADGESDDADDESDDTDDESDDTGDDADADDDDEDAGDDEG